MNVVIVRKAGEKGWQTLSCARAEAVEFIQGLGYPFIKEHENQPVHAAGLEGAPIFKGLCGPFWDGTGLRYECPDANRVLSAD